MPFRRLVFLALLSGALFARSAAAQIPGLSSSTSGAATPQNTVPPDPLGRDNPRGCVLGFIKAAQEEKYALAANFFEPYKGRRRNSESDDEELAVQLLAILNQKFGGPLEMISRDPQGRLDDGLPPDEERVSNGLGTEAFPIILVRTEDEQGRKLWYFSRATLERVPAEYDSLTFPEYPGHPGADAFSR